jgi:hypothetical protein
MSDEMRSTIPKGQTLRLIFYFFEWPLNALEERQASRRCRPCLTRIRTEQSSA